MRLPGFGNWKGTKSVHRNTERKQKEPSEPQTELERHTEEKAGDSEHHTARLACATAASLLLTIIPVMEADQKTKMVTCLLGATGLAGGEAS